MIFNFFWIFVILRIFFVFLTDSYFQVLGLKGGPVSPPLPIHPQIHSLDDFLPPLWLLPPHPPVELEEVVVEVEEVGLFEAADVEVEQLEVPGSTDLELFFLLKNGSVDEILFLRYFHPFGTSDG